MRDLILKIRKSLNLNQPQFADLIGVSKATVSRWESGDRTPTGRDEIGALLRVAPPDLQAQLLEALGIEDVAQFAADLLLAGGVVTGPPYQGYRPNVTDEEARGLFEAKYGRPPKQVISTGGGVMAGPVKLEA